MSGSFCRLQWSFAATVVVAIGACTGQVTEGLVQSPIVTGAVGQQVTIDVRLFGGGPAWDSIPVVTPPPLVSSPSVRFVSSVANAPPYNPGVSTQRFTFEGLTHGSVTVTFSRAGTTDIKTYVIEIQ